MKYNKLTKIASVFLFVIITLLFVGTSYATDCTVTNLEGDKQKHNGGSHEGSLLFLLYNHDCDRIFFSNSLEGEIYLDHPVEINPQNGSVHTRIIGNNDDNGDPKVSLRPSGSYLEHINEAPYLVYLGGNYSLSEPVIENLKVEYVIEYINGEESTFEPQASGVLVLGTNHVLKNIHVMNSVDGIVVSGDDNIIIGGKFQDNEESGIKITSSGTEVYQATAIHNTYGFEILGDNNTLDQVVAFSNEGNGIYLGSSYNYVTKSTVALSWGGFSGLYVKSGNRRNLISKTEFYENGGKGISLANNANDDMQKPESLTALVPSGSSSSFYIIGKVDPTTSKVQLFEADKDNQEGEHYITQFLGSSLIHPADAPDVIAIKVQDVSIGIPLVMTAISGSGNTSEFSDVIVPEDQDLEVDDPEQCVDSDWFLKAYAINPEDPWDVVNPDDPDGKTYEQLDPDHDCDLIDNSQPEIPEDVGPDCLNICSENKNAVVFLDCLVACVENSDCVETSFDSDLNHNGIPDECDNDKDNDGDPDYLLDNCPKVANSNQKNLDGDGRGDACDPDRDNDGLLDFDEVGLNGNETYEAAGVDSDLDGEIDYKETDPEDPDTDSDGYCDGRGEGYGMNQCVPGDNCPTKYNPSQKDSDNDGIGDSCDAEPNNPCSSKDSDGDGVPDWSFNEDVESDNCPYIPNLQIDTDGDGAGDACDPDDDNDGLRDEIESGQMRTLFGKNLDPKNPDSDEDGYCDGMGEGYEGHECEAGDVCPGFNSLITKQKDSDSDGIGNSCDMDPQTTLGNVDSDGDKIKDSVDNCPRIFNKRIKNVQTNIDNDEFGNACDADSDADMVSDVIESANILYEWWNAEDLLHIDPSYSIPMICAVLPNPNDDADEDGIPDVDDNCPFVPNPDQSDSDMDGIGNDCDNDIDGDGILNADDNCPYKHNPDQKDSDQDGIGDVCEAQGSGGAAYGGSYGGYGSAGTSQYDMWGGAGKQNGGCSMVDGNMNMIGLLMMMISLLSFAIIRKIKLAFLKK